MKTLRIGGVTKFTTIDFPRKLAAVIFCQGCPYRCPYCHNNHLQPAQSKDEIDWEDVIDFLISRKDRLDGVVFSGGEPLMQSAIEDAINEVKKLGFSVALHTTGHNPALLDKIITDIDWIGLDIKTNFDCYDNITSFPNSGQNAKASLEQIIASKIEFEARTTLDPTVIKNKDDLIKLALSLKNMGVKNYVLQEYRPIGRENEATQAEIKALTLDKNLIDEITNLFENFEIRN
ncbi:MAG: anaerobic ribonucleoside-triphosphate reductase activating protein [Alphaproteobacteria bacterium]|nr:anaerobic ribonucleoside-triphosphate reductase activating protein [Alphaproteobacteria bacterium]